MKILQNDTTMDITHKLNAMELDNWINHLHYVNKELNNIENICSTELSKKLDIETLLENIHKKQRETRILLEVISSYSETENKLDECEDTKCVTVFVNNHESLRRSYEYHLTKHDRLKEEFYAQLNSNLPTLKRENLEFNF